MNKTELLQYIHAGRKRLDTALARLSEDQMAEPALYDNWSVKDLLAHIRFWERVVVITLGALLRGDIPDSIVDGLAVGEMPLDDLNTAVYAKNQDRPLAEVRRNEEEAYQELLTLVERASAEDLFNPDRYAWMNGTPYAEWVRNNTYEHYDEHLEDLLAWLNGRVK